MLIILGGLPGSGKTTIAKELAKKLPAVHLRIDTIETAFKHSQMEIDENKMDVGYLVAYDIAVDNLKLGHTVIADSVNPIDITRNDWRDAAKRAGVDFVEIELYCEDKKEHKKRVETRISDIKGQKLPTWAKVEAREYHPWDLKGFRVNTAKPIQECVDEIISKLQIKEF